MPFQSEDWYVVAEEPGHPLTQVGPIAIALEREEDARHRLHGRGPYPRPGQGVPPGWEGHLWVVAFSKTAVREEARVAPDGTFSLPPLPPASTASRSATTLTRMPRCTLDSLVRDHPEAFKETADPWKRAKVVNVEAGRETSGVELELPK